jgi:hypothetical protein
MFTERHGSYPKTFGCEIFSYCLRSICIGVLGLWRFSMLLGFDK